MASNELIAHTLTLKYQHAMPLYRQENYFDMMGARLSRQTLCNWTMSAAEALKPIYNHMKKELLNRNYIHADETTLKVINDIITIFVSMCLPCKKCRKILILKNTYDIIKI